MSTSGYVKTNRDNTYQMNKDGPVNYRAANNLLRLAAQKGL